MIYFYLLSGLFLGWSLGANDAANIFGTAVSTKMLRFKTAAILASLFVIIGAVAEGSGASHTLGKLGSVNALPGAFTVALAAGISVTAMTRFKLPVSTSQAIVGAIIGWNLFSGSHTDFTSLTQIVSTWIISPILAGLFAFLLYKIFRLFWGKTRIHLLKLDAYTRISLIIVGIFGAYSLGANNIANVMGVFVEASPFNDLQIYSSLKLSNTQILFFLGALAIGVGIFSYSIKVMKTVGKNLFRLSPVTALIVVLAESLVLYIFASNGLRELLISLELPAIPLVPVSSSQAVIGAVLGIAFAKGGRNIQFDMMAKISSGWVITPIISGLLAFLSLFFMKNVFDLKVYEPVKYTFTKVAVSKLEDAGIADDFLEDLKDVTFENYAALNGFLKTEQDLSVNDKKLIIEYTRFHPCHIGETAAPLSDNLLTKDQINTVQQFYGTLFLHKWQMIEAFSTLSPDWKFKPENRKNRLYNEDLDEKYNYLLRYFRS